MKIVSQKFYDDLVNYVATSGDIFSSQGLKAMKYSAAKFLLDNFDKFYRIMKIVKVPVVNKSTNQLPAYAENGFNSGCDARAHLLEIKEKFLFNSEIVRNADGTIDYVRVNPGGRALIPTGLHVAIPVGYEIQVRDRSGQALNFGIMITNGVGTIDSSYRGDIGIVITNSGTEPFDVHQGDRIAQLVLKEVPIIEWVPVDSLDETARGEGGFTSTGVK